jgi:hypothetical protein
MTFMGFKRLVGALSAVFLVVGCGAEPMPEQSAPAVELAGEGLALERGASTLSGAFAKDGTRVEFRSEALSPEAARLFVALNGKRFDFEVDFAQGVLSSDGHGAMLVAAEREVLAGFARTLGSYLVQGPSAPHEQLVAVQAEYWSEAPEGYVHPSKSMRLGERSSLGNADDGITCITKNTSRTAYYDNSSGQVYSQSVVVNANWGTNVCGAGDYSCMGRCGAACGWGAPSAYTLDCLDHDVCSHNLCASGGGSDVNCGDEYNQAQDDWTWGVSRGCSG